MPLKSTYSNLPWRDRLPLTVGVPISVHTYFHRTVFAGSKGAVDAMLATFVEKLYAELQPRITKWDIDNDAIVADVLSRLNFDAGKRKSPAGGTARRRTNSPLAKPSVESGGSHDVNGTTP